MIVILSVGGIAIAMIAGLGWLGGFRINLTPSEPLGLWRIVLLGRPVAVGDLVFVCPPPGPISAFGLERGYFQRGLCPGGAAPLIKIVAASAGACIEMAAEVTIDGATLPHARLSIRDGAGRLLSPWGDGAVPPGQLFLHSASPGPMTPVISGRFRRVGFSASRDRFSPSTPDPWCDDFLLYAFACPAPVRPT